MFNRIHVINKKLLNIKNVKIKNIYSQLKPNEINFKYNSIPKSPCNSSSEILTLFSLVIPTPIPI